MQTSKYHMLPFLFLKGKNTAHVHTLPLQDYLNYQWLPKGLDQGIEKELLFID